MSLYTRARKHIDMDRVKELREEKLKEKKIADILRQQERIRAELEYIEAEESKYINWRRELEEGMNTSGMGMINYPANGDVDIIDTSTTYNNLNSGLTQMDNYSRSGTTVTLQGTENQIVGGTHTYYNVARYEVDGTTVSHVKITISKGGGTSSWTDRDGASNFDDGVTLNISDADDFFAPGYYDGDLSSGTHIIPVPGNYKNLLISFEQFGKVGETGALRITNVSLQRRTPVNVFVSLDDPESSAFVRDGDFDRLSNEQKKKKLEEQLKSSEDYLNKMYGEGMPKGATTIADYEPQKSFSDIKVSLSPEDLKAISDRVGGSYSGSKGTEIAAAQQGPIRPGPRGYKKPGTYDPKKFFDLDKTTPMPSPNLPATGPGYSSIPDGTKVAASYPKPDPLDKLLKDIDDVDKKLKNQPPGSRPGKGRGMGDRWDFNKFVKGKGNTMVAHHEPQGKVIKEKKSFKDITKKIPGYYDGKPSPLGFPVEEPPKMKNGFHPDLVDGKKVANRFNRLDPQSAKAMPKTGNPHIDKKVRAAAKKPK